MNKIKNVFLQKAFQLFIFLFLGSLFCPSISAQDRIASRMPWSAVDKLAITDFRGYASGPTDEVAATHYQIGFEYSMRGDDFIFEITCDFVRNQSWMRKDGRNEYILNHEQKHFDLAEVYARMLRKRLREANITLKNHSRVTDDIYNQVWRECQRMQKVYDHETEHSIDREAQKIWDKKIERMLWELEGYQR